MVGFLPPIPLQLTFLIGQKINLYMKTPVLRKKVKRLLLVTRNLMVLIQCIYRTDFSWF